MSTLSEASATRIAQVTAAAAAAAPLYAAWPASARRDLLHRCAAALEADADAIIKSALVETGLTEARLRAEMDRTTGQLRLLGDHVAAGKHLSRLRSVGKAPQGGDIVNVAVPIGPVAVFAASNFPFAFGIAGGDTASALAAGCPVVVKAHHAQPETSRLQAASISRAVAEAGAPEGLFAILDADSRGVGIALVQSPPIRAVGFTGSLSGGRALLEAATARPDPIPVYAEMGSVNPVFVLPDAARDGSWAATLATSVTGSSGQLCTKPGLIIVPDDESGKALAEGIAAEVAESHPHRMLTEGMASSHADWARSAVGIAGARVTPGEPAGTDEEPAAFTVEVSVDDLTGPLLEEHFGPTAVLVRCPIEKYGELAERMEASLTATIVATDADKDTARTLLPTLVGRAGRIIWNGVPTGVAVCEAMHHGGPWPATSAAWSTSVGTESIRRFLRPVAVQGLPDDLLDAVAADVG